MKTIYEKWIAANESLAKCYEQVPYEQYQSLSLQERETLCLEEKRSVQAYLNSVPSSSAPSWERDCRSPRLLMPASERRKRRRSSCCEET